MSGKPSEFIREFAKPVCAVHDERGKHCPDEPITKVMHGGKLVSLCGRCYDAWKAGAYDSELRTPTHPTP